MKIISSTLGLLLSSGCWLAVQVSVELDFEREQYLRNESLPVLVRITNFSGQTLHLGEDDDWLGFVVEGLGKAVVRKVGEVAVRGEFSLESSMVATREVNLAPAYRLSRPGRYSVTATLNLKQWGGSITSKPATFTVIHGTVLWERLVGLPAMRGAPEVRKFALLQATFLKELVLYVRLTDPSDGDVIRVAPLGQLVSFSRPEAQIDKFSNLHALFQTGARAFDYCVVSPDGELIGRQTHDYAETRPTLKSTAEGLIMVSGGIRRVTERDIPAAAALKPALGE